MTGHAGDGRSAGDSGAAPVDGHGVDSDPLLQALSDLVHAAAEVDRAVDLLTTRAVLMSAARGAGTTWREIVEGEERPLIAEMLTETISRFEAAGTRFRQVKARTLHQEGMTMEQIARLFGVSRQRISVLLHASSPRRPQ